MVLLGRKNTPSKWGQREKTSREGMQGGNPAVVPDVLTRLTQFCTAYNWHYQRLLLTSPQRAPILVLSTPSRWSLRGGLLARRLAFGLLLFPSSSTFNATDTIPWHGTDSHRARTAVT